MTPESAHRCWVEIDLNALRHNVRVIRHRIGPHVKIMAVVKADAYGHGLATVARVLMDCGVDAFAVANVAEAEVIRQTGGSRWPILMFGSVLPFEIEKIAALNITPTISTIAEATLLETFAAKANRPMTVQVEIDAGMGRVGFWHAEAVAAINQIKNLPHLRIDGLYMHFPSADENLSETRRHLDLFLQAAHHAAGALNPKPFWHAANSAGLLNLPEARLDMVRLGLLLYGVCPAGATAENVLPVLSFKARVAHVKSIEPGRTLSYGQTFVAQNPMRIATVTAGYADGFSRHLSNRGEVLIGGRRCRVVGRVTMDQIMVDVTALPDVSCGDEVVFIGQQGTASITANEMAAWAGTIPWEILCGTAKPTRVARVYHGLTAD